MMMRAVTIALCAAACSSTSLPSKNCNPLGENHCMTPWPSSVFEVDAPTSTGRQLAIPAGTLPTNSDGTPIDPTAWNLADGFSPAAPITMSFPTGVAADALVAPDNMDASLGPSASTVLLDMTTNQRVAHWAELDAQAIDTPDRQALFIRPAQRLTGGHRYAVAITKAVKAANGKPLPIPAGFAALRDNKKTDHPLLERDRARLDQALNALSNAGFPRDQLVVAWDFTVASDDFLHRDMTSVANQTQVALASHQFTYAITSDMPIDDGSVIKRRVTGTFDAPLYLTNHGTNQAGTTIARDGNGSPMMQGFYTINFTAIVPACAYSATVPVGAVIYGHGLLGSADEAAGGVQQTTAAQLCLLFIGTDLRGMSGQDIPAVARLLNDATLADEVMEVLYQGLSNYSALTRFVATTNFLGNATSGNPLVDGTKIYYYGLSQGAIFGASFMAYDPYVKRAALGVGAANYSIMLDRSSDWPMYHVVLNGGYSDPLDDELVLGLVQMRWDHSEPSGIADSVLVPRQGQTAQKQLLMQLALGDDEVANQATYWEARSMGVPVLAPTPFTPWGLQTQQGPLTGGSVLVIEDGGVPPPPLQNLPPPKLGMHDLTRDQPASRRQIGTFYATGQIVDDCANGGPCVCPSTCQ